MSYPHLQKDKVNVDTGTVTTSMNSGIEISEHPTWMANIANAIKAINAWGPGVRMVKVDWSDAYMHLPLQEHDMPLHVMNMGGRFFVNKTLSFGSKSSPGLYDRCSFCLVDMSILQSATKWRHTTKCVDDTCSFGFETHVMDFYNTYTSNCRRCGVRLAPEEDDKAFACSTEGTVLGFHLNLSSWEMRISDNKLAKILIDGFSILDDSSKVEVHTIQSFMGRVQHCARLFPHSKWERSFLLSYTSHDGRYVKIGREAISQVLWWLRTVSAYSLGSPIPHLKHFFPWHSAVFIYTDAAGGCSGDLRRGMGGCVWSGLSGPRKYFALPWPKNIRLDWRNSYGVRMGKKLTMLESTAVTTAIACFGHLLKNKAVVVMTDNIGVVWSHKKGSSRDLYTHTISKACDFLCQKMNINLRVEKVRRCSDQASIAADLLSKGHLHEAINTMGSVDHNIPYIPRTIVQWLDNPIPSRVLGRAIIEELIVKNSWSTLPLDFELEEDIQRVRWNNFVNVQM